MLNFFRKKLGGGEGGNSGANSGANSNNGAASNTGVDHVAAQRAGGVPGGQSQNGPSGFATQAGKGVSGTQVGKAHKGVRQHVSSKSDQKVTSLNNIFGNNTTTNTNNTSSNNNNATANTSNNISNNNNEEDELFRNAFPTDTNRTQILKAMLERAKYFANSQLAVQRVVFAKEIVSMSYQMPTCEDAYRHLIQPYLSKLAWDSEVFLSYYFSFDYFFYCFSFEV
jgi:hypothetical protein